MYNHIRVRVWLSVLRGDVGGVVVVGGGGGRNEIVESWLESCRQLKIPVSRDALQGT